MREFKLFNDGEYKSDRFSSILFEDEHSFSFGKLEIENCSLKFGWNSKGINPEIKFIDGHSFVFIGIDIYVVGYDYVNSRTVFFLNTSSNFKWFDNIDSGIAIVTETGVILVNITNHCTLRTCIFFADIIVDTVAEQNKMRISFLDSDDKIINT